jgi:hypothetical protein
MATNGLWRLWLPLFLALRWNVPKIKTLSDGAVLVNLVDRSDYGNELQASTTH